MKRFFTLFFPLFFTAWLSQAQSIMPTGVLSALSTTYGTASSETSFTFSASSIGASAILTVTPPSGFEVSKTSGSGFASSISFTATSSGGGNIAAGTAVYVRLKATATVAGSPYSGNITLVSGATSANEPTTSSTVNPKTLTITGVTATSKVYDGSTATTVGGTPVLNGVLAGDVGNVTIDASGATGNFSDANVGTGKTVNGSGYAITGSASGNYSLTQPTATATITTANLTITGATASNKTYDKTTPVTLGGSPVLSGVIAGDVGNVTLDDSGATGNFSNANVGTGKTITTSGYTISGSASANYTLTQPSPTADISAKALTITGATANNKGYDATTAATLGGTPALLSSETAGTGSTSDGKPYTGDAVSVDATSAAGTFASTGPGVGINVNTSGYALSGAQAGNYSVTQPTLSATIYYAQPTAQSTTMTFTSVSNTTLTVNWTVPGAGGGTSRILVVKQGGAPTAPTDGTTYTDNPSFGSGTDIGSSGSYVMYIGSGNSVALSGFTANTSYTFNLYEFNGSGGTENYLITSPLSGTQKTTDEPANYPTGFTATATATAITLNWTGSAGTPAPAKYLIVARDVTNSGAYPTFSDGTAAPANDANLSSQTSTWNGVESINFGTNTYAGWSNLTSGNQYEFTIYPYTTAGTPTPDYKTSPTAPVVTVFTEPSSSASTPTFSNITDVSIDVTVGGATGASGGYLVVRKAGGAPGTAPSDGTAYTVGSSIAAGETVVYTSAAGTFTDSGLTPLTTYYYKVYPYSGSGVNVNYKITSPSGANTTTLCTPPSTQATNVTFGTTVAGSMVINWTRGTGTGGVIVLMRDGSAVGAAGVPSSGTSYSDGGNAFGSGSSFAESGNDDYVVYVGTGSTVTVTNLTGNHTYYVSVMEYNTTGTCYNTTSPATGSKLTPNADVTSTLSGGTGSVSLSSIATTQATEVVAFTFTANDLASGDGVSTRFTQLIFRPGPGNYATDWTQIIQGAELYSSTFGPLQHGTAIIGTNTITIPSISANDPPDLGSFYDGTSRTYTLKIWFKTTLGGTLPSTIDNKNLVFSLTGSDATPVSGRSQLTSATTTNSGSSNDAVDVQATQINVTQQPTTSVNAYIALPTQPIFEATDAKGNRDLDINSPITVNTSPDLGLASPLANFSSGVADFTGSGLNFHNTGTSPMTVSISSPSSITSTPTNAITVTASTALGSSAVGMSPTPLINSTVGLISGGSATNAVLGFSLQTTGSPLTLTDITFTSSPSSVGLVKNFKLYSNTTDSFTGATLVTSSTTLTFGSVNVPIGSAIKYFYLTCDVEDYFPTATSTIQFSIATSGLTISTGNKTGGTLTGINYSLVDNTAPVIQSILTMPSYENPWGTLYSLTTPAYNGNQADFLMTFSEPVQNMTPSKLTTSVYSGNPPNYPGASYTLSTVTPTDNVGNAATTPSQYWRISYTNLAGSGYLYNNYTNNPLPKVIDVAGNIEATSGSFVGSGKFYYYLVLPKPTNSVSSLNLNGGPTTTSISLSWIQPAVGSQAATHYLIRGKESALSFSALNNGVRIADDADASDGFISVNIANSGYPGSSPLFLTNTFSNLKSGKSYDFEIYPYTISPNVTATQAIEYNLTPATLTSSTTTVASAQLLNVVAVSSISSLTTTQVLSEAQTTPNLQFDLRDELTDLDNAPTKFSDIIVFQGAGNAPGLSDWTQAIAGAILTDGTTKVTGTVSANQISFTGFSHSTNGDFGFVPDGSTPKTYSLYVWLKTSLGGSLPSTIDNLHFSFLVNNGSFTMDNASSNQASTALQSGQSALSGAGANQVSVVASQLVIATQPTTPIGVATNFPTAPIINALDANGNLDLGYSNVSNITNTGGLTQSLTSQNFSAGVLALNSFNFTSAGGPTQIQVTGTGVPAVGSVNSTNVTTVISNLTSISAGAVVEPASFSSLTTSLSGAAAPQLNAVQNFDFDVTDDFGANTTTYDNNDGLPTLITALTITQNSNNGTNGGGDPLFDDWTNSIAGAELSDGATSITASSITATTIVFTSIPITLNKLGYVPDGTTKKYRLKIWLKNPVNSGLSDIIDNKDFVFDIAQSGITITGVANTSSTMQTSNTNSGDTNNKVNVTATKLDFITQWANNANQNYDAALSPTPTAKAHDVNGNLDTDYNTAVTVATTVPATYPVANSTVTNTNGMITFNSGLKVTSAGGGLNGATTNLVLTSGSLTGQSNPFILNYSGVSDVVRNTGFSYPTDIDYASVSNQTTDITGTTGIEIEEYTVRDGGGSSDADGTPTVVGSVTFTVQNIYLLRKLALYNNLGNEVAEIDVQASKIGNNVTFSGLPVSGVNAIIAPDNTTIDFTVKASFLSSNIADNDVVNLNVTAIASASVSSAFTAGASTTMPTLAANENAIEVTATQLNFTHPTLTEASASINVPYTAIYIRAEDAFNNLDVDYTGSSNTVTTFTNNGLPTVTMTNGPVNGTTQFTNGIIDFAASFPNFEFTTGNNGETFTMSMTSAGSLSGTSNTVTLKVSAESSLQLDPSFKNTISPNLPWVQHINYLDSATFGSSTNGYELMRTLLVDGSRTNYNYHNAGTLYGNYLNAVTDDDANGDGDLDGAPSVLSGLSVRIYGASSLNTIALYDSTGTIIPSTLINVRSLNLVRSPVGGVDTVSTVFNWSGTLLTAKDDGQAPMSIRVTFRKDVNIRDQDTLRIKLLSATAGNGSQFYKNSTSGYIGGENHIPNPAQSIAKVDVVATSLDFTTQPSQYAGTSEPVGINPATSQPYSYGNPATLTSMPSTGSAIVKARDIYKNLDLDFTYPATSITITDVNETIASPAGFIKGILDLNGLVYTKAGTGTLKVKAGTLDSSVPPAGNIGNSIPGQLVNVINVKATLQTNGVLTTQNLKGGSTNLVIFGVTLSPESQTATEPVLKKLIISFDNPFQLTIGGNTTNILKNFKVKESISASPSSAQDVVATLGGTITYAASPALLASEAPGQPRAGQIDYDMLVIDLSSSPRPFRDPNNNSATSLTYYLFADVDVTANISTPSLTPMVTDLGYLNADDANILLSEGTARSDSSGQVRPVRGISFRFASTRPPQLLASQCSPFNGQLNVDPAIDSIKLSFDVSVWSLDGKAKLYKRVVNGTNVQVADLIAANGEYYKFLDGSLSTPPMAASPINFYISFLDSVPGKKYKFQYDTVYYVNITKGSLNGNVGSGISDNGFNYYGGISSSSTYYFKISSNVPPTLSLAKTIFSNSTTVAFQTTYDQLGTAFYLVLNSGSPVPTVADIIDPTTYKIIHPGTYIYNGKDTIKQVNSAQTTTFFTPTPLSTSSTYDVWVFAQNDAQPVPKKAAGPYLFNSLSNTFTTSPLLGTGPTFKIPTSTGVNIYSPSYTLCPNSFINLTDPIIIGEANVGDFSSPSAQDFYLYLPTGYQFDGTTKPDVLLNGTDFTDNTPKIDFINRTLIHVSNYTNQGSASIDNIIISNLRVIGAAGSGSGKVTVFAGTNKLSSVLPTLITTSSAPVANISLFSFTPPDFVNSYSTENKFPNPPFGSTDISTLPPSPFPSTSSVTYIPNNYIDKDQALAQSGSIRLLPVITSPNDYNASFFTGSGVTNDQLTLSAVALNAAFDITMTHTDPNGCASSVSNQYLVYDHTRPVSKKLGSAYSGTALEGTAQAIINTNFGVGSAASIPSQILNLDDLTGYKLINLRANIPAGVVNHQVSQIMSDSLPNGPWQKLIAKIPVAHDSTATSANPTGFYRGYQWDYAHILNAVAESGNSISIDPYDNFKVIGRTQAGNDFWTGGSLGKVEFTGSFQSQADFTVIVPFRQEVELFVPAVPVIEVASANQSSYDALDQVTNATDGMTPKQHFNESQFTGFTLRKGVITTDINSASVVGIGTFFTTDLKVGATIKDISKNKIGVVQSITDDTHLVLTGNSTQSVTNGSYTASGYQGTPVFCEAGGSIILNAYPAASANASGIFSVYDFKSYNFAGFVTRTGTISTQSGSTQVVGTGTLFTTELTVGSVVSDGSGVVIGTVGTITDNLHLTLKTSAPSTIADGIFRANLNVPLATSSTSSGFIDNGNGSMTLNSALIKNGYNDILVSYSYRDNNSPAVGTAYMVLRVTPNPVAQFTVASIPAIAGSPGASAFDAFCVNNQIKFNADSAAAYMQKNQQASQAGTTPNTISNYVWDFGDPNSGLPNSPATPNAIPNSPALPGGEGGTIINTAYQQPGTSTTQTYNAPFHIYATSSSYNVALTLTSNWGCTSLQSNAVISLQQASVGFMGSAGAIAVGDIPSVKFDFAGNCVSDPIKFSDKGSSLLNTNGGQVAVSNWDWNFGDSGVGTGKNTTHVYTNSGFFGVTLTETTNIGKLVDVTSTSGCKATATKNLAQLPLQKPTATASYFEYFGAGNGGWLPLDATGGSGSWVWGSTSGKLNSVFNTGSADSLWVTKLSGTYNPNEQSSLYSVCLDLTNLPRPMLSFNGFVNLLQGDGLVAEYSYDTLNISDPNKSWVRLGSYDNTTKLSDGLEWYNASGLPSVPGGSASNASGQGWAGDSVKWIHPKHELDEVKSATAAYAAARGVAARSILRFALSTLGNSSNTQADGVGIDSVRIGSRTRTIMFENFTTTDGGNSNLNATLKTEADSIISFNARTVGTQLVNINYHIGFLGKDPFNMDNPADPSARALYYHIQKVPYAFLDGVHSPQFGNGSDLFKDWGQRAYNLQTLELAKANFADSLNNNPITTVTSYPLDSVGIDVHFTPVITLPKGTVLHVAVVEENVQKSQLPSADVIGTTEDQFEFVLKKMLPDAAGTKFTTALSQNVPVHRKFTWRPDRGKIYSNSVAVVLFLQNDSTKEIYQAEMFGNITPPGVITEVALTPENVTIYPNPSDREFVIELPEPTTQRLSIRLANQLGQYTEAGEFAEGEQKKTVSTQGLADGMYIVTVGNGKHAIRSKVIVVHK